MSREDVRRVIEVQAEALGPVLHAGVATALAAGHKRRAGLDHSKYPHLLPFIMRAELREFLDENSLPNDWIIDGDPRKMGQLLLRNTDLNLETRFLKERRTSYPNGVPTAGGNQARRKVWADLPLDLDLLSLAADSKARRRVGPIQLLLLWDFLSPEALEEFTLRIVHTISPGVYGEAVPCDLVLDVKDGGEIFKRLEFNGSLDDHDFFGVEIDEGEGESGS
jgi:hypothetical protein